jgi:type IV pilus assembly protein PilA
MAETGSGSRGAPWLARASQIVGVIGLGFAVAALIFANPHFQRLCQYLLILVVVAPILGLVAIVLGLVVRRERAGRFGYWSGGATLGLFLLYWLQMSYPPCGEKIMSNREMAIGSMRTINTAEITYASTYNLGYTADLASLGAGSGPPSAAAAGLIDESLARGKKSGYVFTYAPGPRDAAGKISSYSVSARPENYGPADRRYQSSFFTDQSGVIRGTREDRPATAQDTPISD